MGKNLYNLIMKDVNLLLRKTLERNSFQTATRYGKSTSRTCKLIGSKSGPGMRNTFTV